MASVEAVVQDKIDFEKSLFMKISYHDGIIQTLFKKMGLNMQPHRDENFKFYVCICPSQLTSCATPTTDWVSAG